MDPNAVRFPRELLDLARKMKALDIEGFSDTQLDEIMRMHTRYGEPQGLPDYRPKKDAYPQS